MDTGHELAIRPVRPYCRATTEPSTITVTADAVRSHRTVCQRPSLIRRGADTSSDPDQPRNQHWTMPLGSCSFQLPPATVACPFWTILPNWYVVRSRMVTE